MSLKHERGSLRVLQSLEFCYRALEGPYVDVTVESHVISLCRIHCSCVVSTMLCQKGLSDIFIIFTGETKT